MSTHARRRAPVAFGANKKAAGKAADKAGRCLICLENEPPPMQRGCACRGDLGLSHAGCVATEAVSRARRPDADVAWIRCSTCNHDFTGAMQLALANAWVERESGPQARGNDARDFARQNLLRAMNEAGQYAEVENLARLMLSEYERKYGENHPATLNTYCVLGSALANMEKHADAERIQRKGLAICNTIFGPLSPQAATMKGSLAGTLGKRGAFAEAVRFAEEAVAVLRAVAPKDESSPFLQGASVLGSVLASKGDYAHAERVWREVLQTERRVLGADHPSTLQTAANLGATLSKMKRYEEAAKVETKVLSDMRRVLGVGHAQTVAVSESLSYTLQRLKLARAGPTTGSATTGTSSSTSSSAALLCWNAQCTNEASLVCGGCKAARYCTAACQKSDWKAHKPRCAPKSQA
jgi:tetratricopeptide (TPR) repeat protein